MRRGLYLTCFLLLFVFVFGVSFAFSATTHKVRSGDTLQKIGKKHGVSVDAIKGLNNIQSTALKPGQVLVISRDGAAKPNKRPGSKRSPARDVELTTAENDGEFTEHRVKKGDTLEKLAAVYGVDKDELVELNDIKKTRLTPGSTLLIPKDLDEGDEIVKLPEFKSLKPWKNDEERATLVKVAKSFTGAPYRYGGDSVRGLDCSAFVRKMYDIFDVQLPRTAREQYHVGVKVAKSELSVGDLVFFKTRRNAKFPTHVGIYIGEENFIHASSSCQRGVKVDTIADGYYQKAYIGATRVKSSSNDKSDTADSSKKLPSNS